MIRSRFETLPAILLLASLLAAATFVASCHPGDDDDSADDAGDDVTDDTGGDDAGDDTGDDDAGDDTGGDDTGDDTGDDDTAIAGCIEGDFSPYWGVLHDHTSYSDGKLTPADAFAYARETAGLDMLVVTDHVEQLYFPLPSDRWGLCHQQADAANDPGNFLADCGFEYGSGFILPFFQSTGHNNVFFSPDRFPMIQLDYHDFYNSLVACEPCIGQFNHPGDEATQTWSDFEYDAAVDQKMNLFEFNGGGDVWTLFFEALDKGWHVSPVYDQDNHDADWGTHDDRRAGYFMSDLTRDALHDAMTARRSFMSMDKNAAIRVMGSQTCWMGSILSGVTTLPFDVEAYDQDADDGFASITIYGPNMELLETVDCGDQTTCEASFDFEITGATYFVARAEQTDGDYLVAAPIWVAP